MTAKTHLPYARPSISEEDIQDVCHALSQPIITRGPLVEAFEAAVATYCGAAFAVAFNSGTAALMAAYYAGDIGPNDRILTTPNTYVATIGAGMQRQANPVFIDIDRTTGNLNLEQLSHNINQPHSKGRTVIVPVHYAGIPVDIQAIDAMITDPETIIIEDAAHAIGSDYKDGTKVGSCAWSHMTIFSFHPAKTLTTGEGGMVTTNDEKLAHRLRLFRNNGMEKEPEFLEKPAAPWYYEIVSLTGNYNFTEFQAALGLSQMKRLDSFIKQRQKLLKAYQEGLSGFKNLQLLTYPDINTIAPHLCVVQIDFNVLKTTRTEVMNALFDRGIGSQLHYIPVYRHPFFAKRAGDISEYFPEMEHHYEQALSLPLFADLTIEDVTDVIQTLKSILRV